MGSWTKRFSHVAVHAPWLDWPVLLNGSKYSFFCSLICVRKKLRIANQQNGNIWMAMFRKVICMNIIFYHLKSVLYDVIGVGATSLNAESMTNLLGRCCYVCNAHDSDEHYIHIHNCWYGQTSSKYSSTAGIFKVIYFWIHSHFDRCFKLQTIRKWGEICFV